MANGKFYLTWYNRYTRWTPAEGGFYLTGRTSDGNNFEEYDVDEVDREMVFSELYTSFMDCIEQFGLSPSDIKKRKHSTYTEWVIERGEGSDREILVLHINRIDPLFSDYEERDDGLEDEDYSSYVWYHKNSRYVDEVEEWELIPESRHGLHERPAVYC